MSLDGRRYLGCDPGLDGGLVVLDAGGTVLAWYDIPVIEIRSSRKTKKGNAKIRREYNVAAMREILAPWAGSAAFAALERVHAMPKQGVVSSFSFGEGYGIWHGLFTGLGFSLFRIPPQEWKRTFGLLKQDKEAARLLASQRWPGVPLGLKKHGGRADALFLAEHLRLSRR